MRAIRNLTIEGKHGKPILTDLYFMEDGKQKPVVILAHGFKGFKDWGIFNLVAETIADAGFVFVKFNFSHNGTTPKQPTDFADLEAFGQNNFSIEMDDLGCVIDWVCGEPKELPISEANTSEIYLMGHSRGGGTVVLKAHEDARVKKLVTWASVSEYGKYWGEEVMKQWKKEGVLFIENSRTKQRMPLYFQMYDNYFQNLKRLHIPTAAKKLTIPALVVHGTADQAVPHQSGLDLSIWIDNAELLSIENGGHTFGGKHPWTEENLPADLQTVLDATMNFFKT